MVNLRYHLVSIVAVFLALGIGITMGSSFLGSAALDQIDKNVGSAESRIRRTRDENRRLNERVDSLEERDRNLAEQGAGTVFSPYLVDTPVLVIAPDGIDDGALSRLTTALESSEADFDGVLRPSGKLRLEGDDADDAVKVVGGDADSIGALRSRLAGQVAADLLTAAEEPAQPPPSTTTTTLPGSVPPPGSTTTPPGTTTPASPDPSTPATVAELVDAGFFEFQPAAGRTPDALLSGGGYRYVIATGPEPDLPNPAFVWPLVRALAGDTEAPVILASALGEDDDPDEVRTDALVPILDDDEIADRVSFVDNLESFDGLAATIIAVQELGDGTRGHYGVGEGADSQLPDTGGR